MKQVRGREEVLPTLKVLKDGWSTPERRRLTSSLNSKYFRFMSKTAKSYNQFKFERGNQNSTKLSL